MVATIFRGCELMEKLDQESKPNTNLHGLAFVLLRVLSIYLFVKGAEYVFFSLQLVYPMRGLDGQLRMFTTNLFMSILYLAGTIWLWKNAERVSSWVVNDRGQEVYSIAGSMRSWTSLSFAIVGLLLMYYTIPSFMTSLGDLFHYYGMTKGDRLAYAGRYPIELWMSFCARMVQLAIGACLLFRSADIVGFIEKGVHDREESK